MISYYKNTLQQKGMARLEECARLCWIYVVNPDPSEKTHICERLGLSPDALEDSLDEYELPRIKIENRNTITILRAAFRDNGTYRTTPVTIIMNDQYIATITTRKVDFFEDFVSGKADVYTTQQSNFFIKTCLKLVEGFQSQISIINRNILQKKKDLKNIGKDDILLFVETEEQVNDLVASLASDINMIKKVLSGSHINLYKNDKVLIDDLLVDGEQVLEQAKNMLRTIKNIRDGYTTVMTINLNQIIEMLTYITVIFTVPMIVSSLYGMNIALPLAGHPLAFAFVILVTLFMIGLTMAGFRYFKKKI